MSKDEDRIFWEEAVKDVSPLPKSGRVVFHKCKAKFKGEREQNLPLKIYRHDVSLGTCSDIDRNTMRRFKREEFKVEAVLDLHGYNESQAYDAVHSFIRQAYLSGKRCVIIVTGKGKSHPDEDIFAPHGVLKDRVPQWLEGEELRQTILSYIHPSARLGGQGAVYILLRRRRN